MKVSLGSWAFSFGPYATRPVPFDAVAKRLSEAGYDGIEVCGFPPHVTPEAYQAPESRKRLVRHLEDLRLPISGYAADFSTVNPIVSGNKQRYLDLLKRNLDLCAAIGSPSIRVDTGAAPGAVLEEDYDSSLGRLADIWHEAAGIGGECGVKLLWEFEPGFVFNKPTEISELHAKVHHPNFQILFDTAHAYMCAVACARQHGEPERLEGGVAELLRKLVGRIGHVHLVDSDGTLYGEETSTHCLLGEGRLDFWALAPRLRAIPGAEWWCVDLCFHPDAWSLIDSSLAYVKRLLAASAQ
ncbi:MAG: sugar phosphate isomerase/epimerase [Acidimicrobiia bacterium]|nr:sugar phosphate isomerase/epimerase [Acidimicrobiia bacterium]